MSSEPNDLRTRRALLAAAAGSAVAVVASAALPLGVAAAATNVQTETDNLSAANTTITDSGADSTAFGGNATGTGAGYGLEGTSLGAGGVVGWSVSAPTSYWVNPPFDPAFTKYTGVFGSTPSAIADTGFSGTGVWGDSEDIGVYGSGSIGVNGYGGYGVEGDANDTPGSIGVRGVSGSNAGSTGVRADARTTAQYALKVSGKVNFSRSGRKSMSSGHSTLTIYLAGVTTGSKVFAVLATSESGRYVRAVVPASGSFKVYLNTTLTSSAVVAWFVLD
jgi:hypothetical protein